MALPLVNNNRNFLYESPKYVTCNLEVLDPLSFGTTFEPSGLLIFFPGMERFEKKHRLKDHVIPLLPIGLLVVIKKSCKISSGDVILQKGLCQRLCMVLVGTRQRCKYPGCRPNRNMTPAYHFQDFIGQYMKEGNTS